MTLISIELEGGPYDGRRIDNIPTPKRCPAGTWTDGWHYIYQPAGRRTTEGRQVYTLTWAAPTTNHPTMQRGEL